MKYDIYANESKIKDKRDYFQKQNTQPEGIVIRYEMPALACSFDALSKFIHEYSHWEKFLKMHYLIASDKDYIQKFIPAAEYYKTAFMAIADKLYSVGLCQERINRLVIQIQQRFENSYETIPSTGQPSFTVHTEVYALKAEIGFFFFTVRSILDSVSTLTHFLYGPTCKQFSSFNDFYKYIIKDSRQKHDFSDSFLKSYFETKMTWFLLLTDVRDYITHFSSIQIGFYEVEDKNLKIYLENKFDLSDIVKVILNGLLEFLSFYDEHTVQRLKSKKECAQTAI